MATPQRKESSNVDDVLEEIRAQLLAIQFGSLEISIHNGRIVQIERREKKRYSSGENTR